MQYKITPIVIIGLLAVAIFIAVNASSQIRQSGAQPDTSPFLVLTAQDYPRLIEELTVQHDQLQVQLNVEIKAAEARNRCWVV